ncbi:hypothetical protein JZO86_17120 [Enterococcus ureasiticus]|uniref:hypothetical protein n=1 Tax=Enterococcus ureasiticus TaxID=903984 RepID=UPI001A8BF83B|nr:hypothetical protein [Enterococcus ureasiticus]MBO0475386.1 hypothetical protein [Enterococcus ureasiticus]
MRILIRKTIAGSEYWDNEEKRSIFVPIGQTPEFEVVENPQSMLIDGKEVIGFDHTSKEFIGFDTSDQQDFSVNNNGEVLDSEGNTEDDFEEQEPTADPLQEDANTLDGMSVKQLREYAKKNDIEIPGAVRAKPDIINIIKEAE